MTDIATATVSDRSMTPADPRGTAAGPHRAWWAGPLPDDDRRHTPIDFIPAPTTSRPEERRGPDDILAPQSRLWPEIAFVPCPHDHAVTGQLAVCDNSRARAGFRA